VNNIVVSTKNQIGELAKTELDDTDKKKKLDDFIINLITTTSQAYTPKGIIAKFCYNYVVNKLIIPNIDDLTQLVYNLIKTKIVGVTK
jgi:hypothetical protein